MPAHMCSVEDMSSPTDTDAAVAAIAAEVRATLARHKIDQAGVADALGLSRSSVSHRINGHRPFSVPELIAVAELAGVAPAEFFRAVPSAFRAA